MRNMNTVLSTRNDEADGRRACAIPTRCDAPRRRSFNELMDSDWAEFVVRYDRRAGQYITGTACCPGAPVCS